MRIGAFELNEPIPELNGPYVFVTLRPWIDVNNVGSLILNGLKTQFEAQELASLAKAGRFFDFTRYRPNLYFEEGIRRISIPNTTLRYAKRERGNDLLFLRLLGPHPLAEIYVDSVLRLLKKLKVKKYCLSLPQYVVLEEDYLGKVRLKEILNLLYNIPIDKKDFERAIEQRNSINKKAERKDSLQTL